MNIGKFDRTYRLDVLTPEGTLITVEPPISITFSITRNTLASANTGQITLYNLGPQTRNRIFKDRFSVTEYFQVRLFAGYGNRLHQVFGGNIYEAWSYKDGTEWITSIDAFDGMNGIQNGFTSLTVSSDTGLDNVLTNVINDMPNVVRGLFGSPAQGTAPRGQVLVGQSSEVINELTDGQYYIDNEQLNVLSEDEVIPGGVILLDPSLLFSTPRRREAFLDVATLFEPTIQVSQLYEIQSLEAIYNGQYRVVGFKHDVTISSAEAGQARTDIQLYFGARGLREVTP